MRKLFVIFDNEPLCAFSSDIYEANDKMTDEEINQMLYEEAAEWSRDFVEEEEDKEYLFSTNITWHDASDEEIEWCQQK